MNNRPGRPKKSGRKHWPMYLYKNSAGTFYFRNPETGAAVSLGKIEAQAINEAIRLNRDIAPSAEDVSDQDNSFVEEDGLLSLSRIKRGAAPISNACGIYFLVASGTVVYVGQSINCGRRILEHVVSPSKTFDSYFVIACDPSSLNELERRYISKFLPYLNINIPGRRHTLERSPIRRDMDNSKRPVSG